MDEYLLPVQELAERARDRLLELTRIAQHRLEPLMERATERLATLPPEVAIALGVAVAITGILLLLWFRHRRASSILRASSPDTPPSEEAAPPAPGGPPGPTARLRSALARTRVALGLRVRRDQAILDPDDYLSGIEEALLLADVGVPTTQTLLGRLRSVVGPGADSADVLRVLGEFLRGIFPTTAPPASPPEGPRIILVAGVNGVGKTTTIGKLAAQEVDAGKRTLLIAADTFRAAAIEQLERWGSRIGVDVIRQVTGADPAAVVVDGLRAARARKSETVFIDTAGRLHTKTNLMEELRKVRRMIDRECPGGPHETLLVLDATTGQNGLQQARIFKEALDVTGVVLTKMDGTARGGIVVAVAAELGLPVRYIGLGEGVGDLALFDPNAFIDAILAGDHDPPARSGVIPPGQHQGR
jgi:fused signal recognition particle receptor